MTIFARMRPALLFSLALSLVGCSSTPTAESPDAEKDARKASFEAEAAPEKPLPPGTVARKAVDGVLLRGPGWLLGRVQTDEVLRQNKFIGWRLVSFPADWDRTGLQPGDVITDLNGVSLEKPEDLWTAWLSMAESSELRISFERDGKPAMTVVKIDGEPLPDTRTALESGTATPPAEAASGQPKKRKYERNTIVITDETTKGSEDDTSSMYY